MVLLPSCFWERETSNSSRFDSVHGSIPIPSRRITAGTFEHWEVQKINAQICQAPNTWTCAQLVRRISKALPHRSLRQLGSYLAERQVRRSQQFHQRTGPITGIDLSAIYAIEDEIAAELEHEETLYTVAPSAVGLPSASGVSQATKRETTNLVNSSTRLVASLVRRRT